MKIPKRFKLLGRTVDVVWRDDLAEERNFFGMADYTRGQIQLQKICKQFPQSKDNMEHTFCHELVHWIIYSANKTDGDGNPLHQNEELVDILGGLLHQALTTMEYR